MSELDQDFTANYPPGQGPNERGIARRRVMRPLGLAVPVALFSLVAACGSSDTPATSASSPPAASETSAAGAAGSVLTASVGEGDKPVITLMDSAGAAVTSLKAGSYTVNVKDLSTKHNFHLTGTGVEEKTTVPEVKDVTWTVTLAPGSYTFKCDPHAPMTGTFTVT